MSEKALTNMNYDEFQSLIEGYIDRSSQESGEMSAPTFFELLFDRMAERVMQTIELEGEIIGNQLILRLPADRETAVQVQDNEIVVGDQRIVVKLKNHPVYPTAVKRPSSDTA